MVVERRVAAVCLPQLLIELSRQQAPCGLQEARVVVWASQNNGAPAPHLPIQQACMVARARGIGVGMTVAAARSLLSNLSVQAVARPAVHQALETLSEYCLTLSPAVMPQAPDLLWLEVTGTAHLFGGEKAWAQRVLAVLAAAGHTARMAVASGPQTAAALARYAPRALTLLASGQERDALWPLPVGALGLQPRTRRWLRDTGLRTLADLARQPREALARRLGAEAPALRLLDVPHDPSADASPLTPYTPPEALAHSVDLREHPVHELEALLFAAKRAADRLALRLATRQLAAQQLVLDLSHGPGLAPTQVSLPLALPLWHAADLLAALRPMLERTDLPAAVQALTLLIPRTQDHPAAQEALLAPSSMTTQDPRVWSRTQRLRGQPEDALPRLWAELVAELGPQGVGVLGVQASHRPEDATLLLAPDHPPPQPALTRKPPRPAPAAALCLPALDSPWFPDPELPSSPLTASSPPPGAPKALPLPVEPRTAGASPLRLLPDPLPLPGWPQVGQPLGQDLPAVVQIHPARRLWAEWWRPTPLCRDYAEVELEGGGVGLVFVETHSGQVALHGWMD